jgi:hypothetical protein
VFAHPLSAISQLVSLESYEGFILKKEMWVCNSIAFPVDISYDAFNVNFKTIAQSGYGYFIQVKPGTYTNANAAGYPDADNIIQNPSSGVLNVTGKPAGVYEYIFVSESDDFCGMFKGEKSVVRVYLAPQLTGFPVLSNVCPGKSEQINFNDFIPPEIRYFLDEMGWTVAYTRDGEPVEMPVTADLKTVGDNVYQYTINDSKDGPFKGKYSEMQNTVYSCPESSAQLTHTVRIREGGEYAIPNKSISYCTDILKLASETRDSLVVNLFGYLGASAPDGKWSVEYPTPQNVKESDLSVTEDGWADITYPILEFLDDNAVFKYSYQDCSAKDTFTLLTLEFKKTSFEEAFTEEEHSVCRNLVSGVVELSSIFGFTAPLTSGIWYKKADDSPDYNEMLYGAVDISEMQSGSLYTFRYDIDQAIDNMCLMQGKSTVFNLRIQDVEVANAELRVCKQQFASGVTVDNLSKFVPGLNDESRIDPQNIIWKDNNGTVINPNNYLLKATEESQTAPEANFRMVYQYEVKSDCGPYTGNLYISAIDGLGADTVRKVIVCHTDDYAKHIDLFQVLGIAGAKGRFVLYDDPVNNNGTKIDDPVMKQPGIMDAFASYDVANESETYTFRYQPNDDICVSENVTVTIIVTRDIEKAGGSDYKVHTKTE